MVHTLIPWAANGGVTNGGVATVFCLDGLLVSCLYLAIEIVEEGHEL